MRRWSGFAVIAAGALVAASAPVTSAAGTGSSYAGQGLPQPRPDCATRTLPSSAAATSSRRDNDWNTPVTGLARHPRSRQWMSHMSPRTRLHPDFGPSFGEQPVPYGIPITLVRGQPPKVRVRFHYAGGVGPGALPARPRHPHRGRRRCEAATGTR